MNIVMLIADGALLLGIVGTSAYGASRLPAGAQLPLHFGPAGYTNWQPKNFALVLWPALGVVLFVILIVTGRRPGSQTVPIVLTIALAVMLLSHLGAIRAALARSGGEQPLPAASTPASPSSSPPAAGRRAALSRWSDTAPHPSSCADATGEWPR